MILLLGFIAGVVAGYYFRDTITDLLDKMWQWLKAVD